MASSRVLGAHLSQVFVQNSVVGSQVSVTKTTLSCTTAHIALICRKSVWSYDGSVEAEASLGIRERRLRKRVTFARLLGAFIKFPPLHAIYSYAKADYLTRSILRRGMPKVLRIPKIKSERSQKCFIRIIGQALKLPYLCRVSPLILVKGATRHHLRRAPPYCKINGHLKLDSYGYGRL